MRTTLSAFCACVLVIALTVAPVPTKTSAQPVPLPDDQGEREHVDLTWFSIANWMFEVGDLYVLMDGYITRVPGPPFFFGGGGGLAFTKAGWPPDVPSIRRVADVIGSSGHLVLMTGHSHFDHSLDTATWAKLTGANITGSKTTCLQAAAQGIPASQCHIVSGGEVLDLGHGLTARVNHSGNPATNPEQHNPVELAGGPTPDPTNGGLHAGVAETSPTGEAGAPSCSRSILTTEG